MSLPLLLQGWTCWKTPSKENQEAGTPGAPQTKDTQGPLCMPAWSQAHSCSSGADAPTKERIPRWQEGACAWKGLGPREVHCLWDRAPKPGLPRRADRGGGDSATGCCLCVSSMARRPGSSCQDRAWTNPSSRGTSHSRPREPSPSSGLQEGQEMEEAPGAAAQSCLSLLGMGDGGS